MRVKREFPDQPVVGVGGVVIHAGRGLLIRRGSEPLKGEWSIPGGTLELGESLAEGVRRELREETGLEVRVLDLIEVFDRVFFDAGDAKYPAISQTPPAAGARPRYHFVIADYLCDVEGSAGARAGSDVSDIAWATEDELARYSLTPTATRVMKRAFAMARERAGK